MALTEKEIIQIDATVITGILILLTISFAGENQMQPKNANETQIKKIESLESQSRLKFVESFKIGYTVTIIVPFAVSAVLAIEEAQKSTPGFRWSVTCMKIGFLYIIVGLVTIASLQIILINH